MGACGQVVRTLAFYADKLYYFPSKVLIDVVVNAIKLFLEEIIKILKIRFFYAWAC